MAKKLKSTSQINILNNFFKEHPNKWSDDDLMKLSQKTKLSRSKVYKWLWDQRNTQRFVSTSFQENEDRENGIIRTMKELES